MGIKQEVYTWVLAILGLIIFLFLFHTILLPFVLGFIIAYFLNPVLIRLEKLGMSRFLGSLLLTFLFFLLLVGVVVVFAPMLAGQAKGVMLNVPAYLVRFREWMDHSVGGVLNHIPPNYVQDFQDLATSHAGDAVKWFGKIAGGLVTSGSVIVDVLSLMFITPLITFYFLRDWQKILTKVAGWLPKVHKDMVIHLAQEIDATLAGFIRGQALVCICLSFFYAVGLGLTGLEGGITVGLVAGVLSFIPYLGSFTGGVLSIGLAFAQFDDWTHIVIVACVFGLGQLLEGNVLSPKLVGNRVGLHPVWMIFALMAAGALFGFVGVLVAIPAAATIGVLIRFTLTRYLHSSFYLGRRLG